MPSVTLSNPGIQSSYDGDTPTIALIASDSAANTLNYSAVNLPAGLSIVGSGGSGTSGYVLIGGTIASTADAGGPYTVVVSATDPVTSESASVIFTWNVSQPTLTLINPGNQGNYDGDTVSLPLSASDSASHTVGYSATGLPAGLYVSSCGKIYGSVDPAADADSPYSVSITATDSAADISDTQTFIWAVSPVTVSLAAPSNQSNYVGDAVSVHLSATDSAGHLLVYSVADATPLPGGLYLDPFSGEISGTIAANANTGSPYSISVTATDEAANVGATQTFTFTVAAVSVGLASPGNQSNFDGDAVSLDLSATDSAAHSLWYSVDPATPLPSGLSLNGCTGAISGTVSPGDDASSLYSVTLIATDSAADVSASQIVSWAIAPVSVSLTNPGDQTNNDGDGVAINLSATDGAGHALVYSVAPGTPLPAGLALDANSGRIFGVIASGADASSPYSISLVATDSAAGVSVVQTLVWTVNPAIGPAFETVTTLENQPVALTTADFGITSGDGTTAVEITSLPTGGTLTDNGTPVTANQFISCADLASGLVIYTPNTYGNGPAYDRLQYELVGSGDVVIDTPSTMIFNVTWVNQAPSFTASNPPAVNPWADSVSIPNWASFNPGAPNQSWEAASYSVTNVSNSALFSQTPSIAANGTLAYAIAGLSGTATFDVQVSNNGGIANGGQNTGSALTFTVSVLAADSFLVVNNTGAGALTLPRAVQAANNVTGNTLVTIKLDFEVATTITLPANTPAAGLTLSKNIRIVNVNGLPITIQPGAANKRVFTIAAGADVEIRNVTIAGGGAAGNAQAGRGGAILDQGDLVLWRDTFTGNSAVDGGALSVEGGTTSTTSGAVADVYYCTFSGNRATNNGGAISVRATGIVNVYESNFNLANTASRGGAIDNVGTLWVKGTFFQDNTASVSGGALNNRSGGQATILGCDMAVNSAGFGGAIANSGRLSVGGGTEIYANSAVGGGIAAQTGAGGGIANLEGGTLGMAGVLFQWNGALNQGGAIYSRGTAFLASVSIQGNSTTNAANGLGGGIYVAAPAAPNMPSILIMFAGCNVGSIEANVVAAQAARNGICWGPGASITLNALFNVYSDGFGQQN